MKQQLWVIPATLSLLSATQAAAQQSSPATTPTTTTAQPESTDIVVIGQRVSDSGRALAACIVRSCPPKEEIDLSLAHAENQFLAGDYAASRSTLLKARHRNAKYAKDLPIDVSDLLRANSRLASLNGQLDSSHINSIDTLDVLKGGLDPNDSRVLMQRLLVGDSFVKQKRIEAAREVYDTVAKQAHDSGQPFVEGHALLRMATLYGALASVDVDYAYQARKAVRRIKETTAPELAPFREAVVTLERRIGAGNKVREVERAELAKTPVDQRAKTAILVYAPPIDIPVRGVNLSSTVPLSGDAEPQWADVTFVVAPDGTVRDIDIVRQSDNARGHWLDLVRNSLAERLYQPLAMPADGPGLRRIERYSLVYDVTSSTISRIRTRKERPRIEMTDLTVDSQQG